MALYRYAPLVRAVPLMGGNRLVYDLAEIPYLTAVNPSYEPIVRDMENLDRAILRKNFGLRMSVELRFEVPFSRLVNQTARYNELSDNQLMNPDDYPAGVGFDGWNFSNASTTEDDAEAPDGSFTAWRVEDISAGSLGVILQRASPDGTLRSHQGRHAHFSLYARADTPHIASIDIRANASPDLVVTKQFTAVETWRRQTVRNKFDTSLTANRSSWGTIAPALSGTGYIHAFRARLVEIEELPGRSEEILSDMVSKLLSDDYECALSLNGGITYRRAVLDGVERTGLDDKNIGSAVSVLFKIAEPVPNLPAVLDGVW